jgi:hypothetical protein
MLNLSTEQCQEIIKITTDLGISGMPRHIKLIGSQNPEEYLKLINDKDGFLSAYFSQYSTDQLVEYYKVIKKVLTE